MKMPEDTFEPISVIIPNLNSKIIDKTIDSILKQNYNLRPIEIIVVGKDKYGLINKYEQVKFIETSEDFSPGMNRNIGIDYAQGDILFFIDADCIASESWIKEHMEYHQRGIDVVGGSINMTSNNFWQICDNISHFHPHLQTTKRSFRLNIVTANLSIKKNLILKVGKFKENLICGEDYDLVMRIRRLGYTLNFEPQAVVNHLPPRKNIISLLKHSSQWGMYSMYIKLRYPEFLKMPFFMYSKFLVLLLSPILAFLITYKIFLKDWHLLKFWYTALIVFLSKIAWCLGAVKSLPHRDLN